MKLIKWITAACLAMLAASAAFSCDEPDPDPVKKDPELKVTPTDPVSMSAAGGEAKLSLMSNVDWTVSGAPRGSWYPRLQEQLQTTSRK